MSMLLNETTADDPGSGTPLALERGAKFTPIDQPARYEQRPQEWYTEAMERRHYTAGWWWGFTSGLIVGMFSMATLGALGYALSQAL